MAALAPFRLPFARDDAHPQPLAYLDGEYLRGHGGINVNLSASLQSAQMRSQGREAQEISRTNPDGHPNSPTYGHLKLPHLN